MKKVQRSGRTVKRRQGKVHEKENSFTGLIEKFRNSVSNLMKSGKMTVAVIQIGEGFLTFYPPSNGSAYFTLNNRYV